MSEVFKAVAGYDFESYNRMSNKLNFFQTNQVAAGGGMSIPDRMHKEMQKVQESWKGLTEKVYAVLEKVFLSVREKEIREFIEKILVMIANWAARPNFMAIFVDGSVIKEKR